MFPRASSSQRRLVGAVSPRRRRREKRMASALTVLCTLAYGLFGMSWLDALTHALSTVSLGGFSSHDASFGFFDSPVLEAITIVFALGSGIAGTAQRARRAQGQ